MLVASCNLITGADELTSAPITADAGSSNVASSGGSNVPDGTGSQPPGTVTPPDTSTSDGGPDGNADGGPPDASIPVDSGPPPPPNLVTNPGFEMAGSSCGPGWVIWRSKLDRVTSPRSGTYACQVCKDPAESDTGFTINSDGNLDPTAKVGHRYRASAWVRRVNDGPKEVELYLRIWNGSSGHAIGIQSLRIDDTWRYVEVEGTVDGPTTKMDLFIATDGTRATDCFLVDDVAVVRLP